MRNIFAEDGGLDYLYGRVAACSFMQRRALDVEEPQPSHEARERKRIDHEWGDRLVGTGAGLVVSYVPSQGGSNS